MIFFPNAKINLGLFITGKRTDGFHNLETVFLPIPFKDAIEITESSEPDAGHSFKFSSSGLAIDAPPEKNLCYRAWQLLKADFPSIPPVKFHLHKTIPMGAGLGGGSADAAFTIQLFNHKFNLGIPEEKLLQYALELGSDCPFFIINKPAFAAGRGENLEPVQTSSLSGFYIVTVFPGIHISTKWAFTKVLIGNPELPLRDMVLQPVKNWRNLIRNNFEPGVFEEFPAIADIKQALYNAGAVYASLSGSGSTVYGFFPYRPSKLPEFPSGYSINTMQFGTEVS